MELKDIKARVNDDTANRLPDYLIERIIIQKLNPNNPQLDSNCSDHVNACLLTQAGDKANLEQINAIVKRIPDKLELQKLSKKAQQNYIHMSRRLGLNGLMQNLLFFKKLRSIDLACSAIQCIGVFGLQTLSMYYFGKNTFTIFILPFMLQKSFNFYEKKLQDLYFNSSFFDERMAQNDNDYESILEARLAIGYVAPFLLTLAIKPTRTTGTICSITAGLAMWKLYNLL